MRAVIIDVEATDSDPKTAQVIEYAGMRLAESPWIHLNTDIDKFVGAAKGRLYGTDQPIKYGALAAHNILPEEIEGLPHYEGVNPQADFVIGHNVDYDAEVLRILDGGPRRICTLAMARSLWEYLDAFNQSALLYYIGGLRGDFAWARDRLTNAHRATDDVENCAVLLSYLLAFMANQGMDEHLESWETLWAFCEDARIPKRITFGKHKGELVENLPWGYVKWYLGTEDQDPYLIKAFRKAGFIK